MQQVVINYHVKTVLCEWKKKARYGVLTAGSISARVV